MLKLLLITLGIVALSVLFLCVKILLKPGSSFGSTHIGGSRAMRERGIHCVQSMDAIERRERLKGYKVKGLKSKKVKG